MRWLRRLLAASVVAALSFGLASCTVTGPTELITPTVAASPDPTESTNGSPEFPPLSSLTPVADPRAVTGPTTVVLQRASIPPREAPKNAALPVTVASRDRGGDVPITVKDTSRIIALSLSGTVSELVVALGMADRLVGRDVSTSFEGSDKLPVITKNGHSVDAEGILDLRPSLILTDGSIGPTDVVLQLRDAGIPVVTVDRASDDESSFRTARQVAEALGVAPEGEALVAELKRAIADKRAEIDKLVPSDPEKRPRVAFLYVRGGAGIYYLFGEGSGADSLISSVGAIDVAKEIGWVGEKPMTAEAMVELDPDVLLVMTKGLESAGGVDGLLEAQPSLALTNAGKNRRIIDVEDTEIFAGGTRIPDVMDGLARALYAPDSLPGAP